MKISKALSVLLHMAHYRSWVADAIRTYRRQLRRGAIERALTWRAEIQARREALNAWKGGAA